MGAPQVFAQWLNKEDDLQAAVESCPVDCIHWVERDQLPVLEHVMATMDRVGVASMQAGQVRLTLGWCSRCGGRRQHTLCIHDERWASMIRLRLAYGLSPAAAALPLTLLWPYGVRPFAMLIAALTVWLVYLHERPRTVT